MLALTAQGDCRRSASRPSRPDHRMQMQAALSLRTRLVRSARLGRRRVLAGVAALHASGFRSVGLQRNSAHFASVSRRGYDLSVAPPIPTKPQTRHTGDLAFSMGTVLSLSGDCQYLTLS
jgi:hypothetical protein